jgi:hypothetical protein
MKIVTLIFALALGSSISAFAQTEQRRAPGAADGPVQGGTMAPPATTRKPKGSGSPVRAPGGVKVAPLTAAQCTGLGGKIASSGQGSLTCDKAGQDTCYTVDKDGVIHHACIDNVQ